MVPFPMTLNEPLPCFEGHTTFDAKYLTNGYRYGHRYYIYIQLYSPSMVAQKATIYSNNI